MIYSMKIFYQLVLKSLGGHKRKKPRNFWISAFQPWAERGRPVQG